VSNAACTLAEAVEQIDIGGPCMIRASAKNHRFVTVVVDPTDYEAVLAEMDRLAGEVSLDFNFELAVKAFLRTAQYDSAISGWLGARR
jgi:phosphoribosylaminoimidazolecarboxamide formyltransferase/IMP cyclohydrolase